MNTATVHQHRPMLPMLSLLAAGAAITLGVVAIATDDAGSFTPSPTPVVTTRGVDAPPVAASSRAGSSTVDDHAGDCLLRRPGVATRC